jgi:hypothetical protein
MERNLFQTAAGAPVACWGGVVWKKRAGVSRSEREEEEEEKVPEC